MKKVVVIIAVLILVTTMMSYGDVGIDIAQGDITINGLSIDNEKLEYPFVVYKDITYFPMTWSLAKGLGLDIKWSHETGLIVSQGGELEPLNMDDDYSNALNQTYGAKLASGKITVAGKEIENKAEEYPLLLFRDITYFPMTWRFMVDEFGAAYSWNAEEGLVIATDGHQSTNQSSFLELNEDELRDLIESRFYDQDIYVAANMDVSMYVGSIAQAEKGISLSVLVAKNYYQNGNDILIVDDGSEEFGLHDEIYMPLIKEHFPEFYEIELPGTYVIDKGTYQVLYVKTNRSDYRYVINDLYSFLDLEPISQVSENEIKEILNRDLSDYDNVQLLDVGEAQDLVEKYFYDDHAYTIAAQNVAEYVESYAKEYSGLSLVKWTNEIEDFQSRNALIINNSNSSFGLMEDESLQKLIKIYPEIYSISDEGFYLIENDDQVILYVVTSMDNYKAVINQLYDGYEKQVVSSTYGDFNYQAEVKRLIENNPTLEDTGEEKVVYFEADPEKGFNYPYVIFLPDDEHKEANKANKKYLLLEGHNFGKVSNDMNIHIYNALTRGGTSHIASTIQNELYIPRVMPIFPKFAFENSANRPEYAHNHALDSTVMFIEDNINDIKTLDYEGELTRSDFEKMYNIEEQIRAIVIDAQNNLKDAGYDLEEKIFIAGFSGAGNFSSRYTSIYPEQVKAMYSGGMFIPFIPSIEYKGEDMIYQLGAYDHEYLFGRSFDLNAYNAVAKIMYLGGQDRHDALMGNDTFTMEQRELAIKLFGNDVPTRWLSCQKAFYEVGGQGQFITNTDQGHLGGPEDIDHVVEFFKLNSNSEEAVYLETSEHDNLIIVNKLEDVQ